MPLRSKLTNTMAGLIAADFDGNGKTDIALSIGGNFDGGVMYVSRDGTGNWDQLNQTNSMSIVAIGRFDDVRGIDILIWNRNFLETLFKWGGCADPSKPAGHALGHFQDMRWAILKCGPFVWL